VTEKRETAGEGGWEERKKGERVSCRGRTEGGKGYQNVVVAKRPGRLEKRREGKRI